MCTPLLTPQEIDANRKVADQMLSLSLLKLAQDDSPYNNNLVIFWKKRKIDLQNIYL